MASSNKNLKKNSNGETIPQVYNPNADDYEALQGENGAAYMKPVGSTLKAAAVLPVTTAGTRVQLPSVACSEVTIVAKRTNTGYIYAGKNTVSNSVYGVELAAKESFTFAVSNANEIYIDASVNGEGISYVAI